MRLHAVSGGGNDFLALVEPERDPTAAEIAAWCARGLSLGADGVFTLRRGDGGRAVMRHWNADGREAALCINGTRCAGRLAFALGWADEELAIETAAGTIAARPTGPTSIALELPPPAQPARRLTVAAATGEIAGWSLAVGVPHFVVPWPVTLADCPVESLGGELRRHLAFAPDGTNVDFVRFTERRRIEIRTFERGVEAETLACGTGVLAATAVGTALDRLDLPVVALTRGGFELTVAGETDGARIARWELAGDARILGVIEPGAEASLPPPPPPAWSSE